MTIKYLHARVALTIALAAFSLGRTATAAEGRKPAFMDHLRWFHALYMQEAQRGEDGKRLAERLHDKLQPFRQADPVWSEALAYYDAYALKVMGKKEESIAVLTRTCAQSDHNASGVESMLLLESLDREAANEMLGPFAHKSVGPDGNRIADIQQACFAWSASRLPNGVFADWVMLGVPRSPARNSDAACEAGDLYRSMHMPAEAQMAYERAVALMYDTDWFSKDTAPLWEKLADAHAAQGHWQLAVCYYCKAEASGGSGRAMLDKLLDAKAAESSSRSAPAPQPKPDSELLVKIARDFLKAELFDEAVTAARMAGQGTNEKARGLLIEIYTAKARKLELLASEIEPGRRFRGTPITKEAIAEARKLAENPDETPRNLAKP